MYTDTSRTGASYVAKHADDNPRTLIQEIVEREAGATREQIFAEFREEIKNNESYQRAIDWYFFVNMYEYLTTSRNKKSPDRAARAAHVEELTRRVREVVFLDLVLPNGKTLADSTFADCAKAGGWFTKVAKMGKPNQVVGKVLTEQQLKAVKL